MVSVIDRATVSEFESGKFAAECSVCAERVHINLAHAGSHYSRAEGRASVTAHPGTLPAPYMNVDNSRPILCAASDQVFTIGDQSWPRFPRN